MNELELATRMRQAGLNLATAKSNAERGMILEKAIKLIIPPRDVSDRTSFRRVCDWVVTGVEAGVLDEYTIFRRVLDYALEASTPTARNPAAVFMSILKKEMKYGPKHNQSK